MDNEALESIPAKRGLAKLYLNSMLGKLTERNDRTRRKMISLPQELCRFLATPGIEVANRMFASDDVLWASWRYIAEKVIGAYVMAGARINFYNYLDRLRQRELY